MRKYIKSAIEDHAISQYPRECCGLIVADDNKQKYIPCENVAGHDQDFKISGQQYAQIEEEHQILAVVHSHINQLATPSEADRVSCENSSLPWYIVAVGKDADENAPHIIGWQELKPKGYEAPLVGRPFHHGVLDCYTLVRDFYRRELGIEIPDFERPDNWWDKQELGELYLDNFEAAGFVRALDDVRYGDVILMQYRSDRTNHGGIYLGDKELKTQPGLHPVPNALLHHAMPRLSERTVYAGYWADITRMIVRHRDLL